MQSPLRLTFRGFDPPTALEDLVRRRVAGLETYHPHLLSCHVLIEKPQHHHHDDKGEVFHVRLEMGVPGRDLVVTRGARPRRAHQPVEVLVRAAFDAARRRLQDDLRKTRGKTKRHDEAPTGFVVRLLPERDCGFIASGGREIYFHRNSVLDDGYAALEVGSLVRFVEEAGNEGPQASTVHALGAREAVAQPIT